MSGLCGVAGNVLSLPFQRIWNSVFFVMAWHGMGGCCCCFRATKVDAPVMVAKWIYNDQTNQIWPTQLFRTRFTTEPSVTAYQHTEFFIMFSTLQKNFCTTKSLFIRADSIIILFDALVSFFLQTKKKEKILSSLNWTREHDKKEMIVPMWSSRNGKRNHLEIER